MKTVQPHSSIAAAGERLSQDIGEHFWSVFKAVSKQCDGTCADHYVRYMTREQHPFSNFAVLAASAGADECAAAIDPLFSLDAPSAVAAPGRETLDDLESIMSERGFSVADIMPLMAVDIDDVAPVELPDGYQFDRVLDDAAANEWATTLASGYEIPSQTAAVFSPLYLPFENADDAAMQFFTVRDENGRAVGTSFVYLADGYAGIYGVATVADARGRGVGAYATAEPLRRAHKRGYGVGILQSSAAGFPVYKRLGFKQYGDLPLFVRMPE